MNGNKGEKASVLIAIVALLISGISTYLSRSALDINEKSARAQLFSNFQQQHGVIASQFPSQHFNRNWRPVTGSEDWLKLKRYWDLCYVEWYATEKLHPELYGPLWNGFYSEVMSDAIEYPSLRGVLTDLIQQQRDTAPHKREFYDVLSSLAKTKGLSLQPEQDQRQ